MDHADRGLQVAIDIAECHHEKYDGTGYPRKLKGEDIPIAARIVALADIYDALRSPRPYKDAFTHEEAFNIITVGDGRTMPHHFDPKVLEAFNEVQEVFKRAYK
jgi:HD-GYP domain-containing protein (c-di-GMP phosphodiesterase class II)